MKNLLCAFALSGCLVGLTGCEKKATSTTKETVTTPQGTTTTTDTHQVESSGSNPPANMQGEKAK